MASHLHELLVRLFRDEPSLLDSLAPSTFSPGRTWLADEGDPTVSDSSLASVRAADLVVGVIAASGARENVIVEVQLHPNPEKVWSWPLYVASIGARTRRTTWLVVVTLDDAVARWARRELRWLNGTRFVPIVIGPGEIQPITDPDEAARRPVAAILSVLAHLKSRPDPAFVSVTEAALRSLDPAAVPYYTDVVLTEFETRAPRLLEHFMPITAPENYEIQFEPLKRLIARGRDEGRVEGEARVLVRQLGRRFGPLDDASRARIERATLDELDAIAEAFADGLPLESILASLT